MYTHSIHNPSAVRFGGPLTPLASGFREELAALGYATSSATEQLHVAAHLMRSVGCFWKARLQQRLAGQHSRNPAPSEAY